MEFTSNTHIKTNAKLHCILVSSYKLASTKCELLRERQTKQLRVVSGSTFNTVKLCRRDIIIIHLLMHPNNRIMCLRLSTSAFLRIEWGKYAPLSKYSVLEIRNERLWEMIWEIQYQLYLYISQLHLPYKKSLKLNQNQF